MKRPDQVDEPVVSLKSGEVSQQRSTNPSVLQNLMRDSPQTLSSNTLKEIRARDTPRTSATERSVRAQHFDETNSVYTTNTASTFRGPQISADYRNRGQWVAEDLQSAGVGSEKGQRDMPVIDMKLERQHMKLQKQICMLKSFMFILATCFIIVTTLFFLLALGLSSG